MKIDKFQKKVKNIAPLPRGPVLGLLPAIWLVEEASEVLKEFKLSIRDNTPLDLEHVKEEIGDTLVGLAKLANDLGLDFDEIAKESLVKLQDRADEGRA